MAITLGMVVRVRGRATLRTAAALAALVGFDVREQAVRGAFVHFLLKQHAPDERNASVASAAGHIAA